MAAITERGIWLPGAADRADLLRFAERARRLDDAAVVRLRARSPDQIVAWAATGLDVLASRVVAGRVHPDDITVAADGLTRALADAGESGHVDPGYAMDSAWRGVLPPAAGFVRLDDVPASVLLDLARRGTELAREHGGGQGPPVSLLDQEVITVTSGDLTAGVPMRCVFALTAMGFLPESPAADEVVRVRVLPAWLRIDARYGSVYRRRGAAAVVLR